jgi:hypothetical protein
MTATSQAATTLVTQLRTVFGDGLRSIVAYGAHAEGDVNAPLTSLALVRTLTVGDLDACARASAGWTRAGIATPLIVPEDEFRRSLDAFPLEYAEILRTSKRLYGDDPFDGVSISADDLRRACETQIKSHLLHLREGFIESGGRPTAIGDLVSAAAPAFTALLRNVARLSGVPISDRMSTTRAGARAAGIPDGLVTDLAALEQASKVPTTDPAKLFPEYLAAAEQLARAVDQWHG